MLSKTVNFVSLSNFVSGTKQNYPVPNNGFNSPGTLTEMSLDPPNSQEGWGSRRNREQPLNLPQLLLLCVLKCPVSNNMKFQNHLKENLFW